MFAKEVADESFAVVAFDRVTDAATGDDAEARGWMAGVFLLML